MPDGTEPQIPVQPQPRQAGSSRGPKNIVICCDGTGNDFGDANSNVVKLYTALAIDNQQAGYYHPGVGTMGDPSIRYRLPRWWSQMKGLAFANGFKDNVLDAYRYLMNTYNDGDKVYLFGFSRGAYTVRALAGLLNGYGLLCKGNEGHIPYAWRLYANQHQDRKKHSVDTATDLGEAFKETFSHSNFSIEFVGVWDTVSSVGWIYAPLRLFNVARNKSVKRARHAVSIDERRCFFRDMLWGEPYPDQNLVQVWFAGVHSDVGGSYPQNESGLSNIALEWMLNEAEAAGVLLMPDRVDLVLGGPGATYPEARKLCTTPAKSIVHESLTGPWHIPEYIPGIYYDKQLKKEAYRVPRSTPRKLPKGALVHHSVYQRLQDKSAAYDPANLKIGKLVPATYPVAHSPKNENVLYEFQPADDRPPATFKRRAQVGFFATMEILLLLIAVSVVLELSKELWHLLHCLLHWLFYGNNWIYAKLGHWIKTHAAASFSPKPVQ
jgi:uncharacterized protein (DUF2235 family)